ncbi:hypothetical protein ZIOFF_053906 [Zingiber officinale]|uniref:HAT C-terminal dimerisation domain-containing protein n=1 Tax=Zingiber officinale TaxID=94328 RepID=A0A8J5F8K0_ZINOF|nr:hypothetical protein ZIOFF_053906 [Zingiber officinale]
MVALYELFHQKDDKGKERIGPPNADDWEISKAFVHFLKNFYDATLELSASKSPTFQLLYQTMIALQVEIDRKRHDDSNPILKEVACAMKLKFDKYWGNWNDINPLIFIGNILDPRNKLQMMKVIVKKLGAQNEEEQLQEISNEVDKYPILSMIAKDVLSIPCSTVASESTFSLGKRIVDPFRSSLSPKMVEALVCTSDWLRAEEFSFWKDPTDDDLELYKEIEEIEKNANASQDRANTSSSRPSTLV